MVVDNLIDKYGKGSTQIHKCQTCEYEENIYSEGTHITEGGSLMVYAEQDLSVQIVAQILSMKITILLVRLQDVFKVEGVNQTG